MILAIDMGNSNIVVGGLDDNKTYFEERITTDDRKTSLEYAILLKNILEIHKVKKNDIEGSIMASVVRPFGFSGPGPPGCGYRRRQQNSARFPERRSPERNRFLSVPA